MNTEPKLNKLAKIMRKIKKALHDYKKAKTIVEYREEVRALRKTHSAIIEYVEAAEPGSFKLTRVAKDPVTNKVLIRATSTRLIRSQSKLSPRSD
jgi:hypothetical protein